MRILELLSEKFLNSVKNISIKEEETFKTYNAEIIINSSFNVTENMIEFLFNSCAKRDSLELSLYINDGEPCTCYNKNDINECLEDFNLFSSECDINYIKFEISIHKQIHNNCLSIYNIDMFTEFCSTLTISEILTNINTFSKSQYIFFNLQDNSRNILFYSDLICFKNEIASENKNFSNKNYILKERNSLCNYLSYDTFDFIPDNFNFEGDSSTDLKNIFNKLKNIFSIISIFNVSKINNDQLYCKIEGYKSYDFNLDFHVFKNIDDLNYYYDIYTWIYEDKNSHAKIEIARNILSLYLINSCDLIIDSSTLKSIRSNYKMYLKDNVEKYLELRSSMIENSLNISNQISDIIDSLTKGISGNIVAIVTFFISVIIMNSLSSDRLDNIFTTDISIISVFIVIGSYMYKKFLIYEINTSFHRIETLYSRLKNSYKNLLIEKDIDEIFNNDIYFNEDRENLYNKIDVYSRYWNYGLALLFFVIILLSRNILSPYICLIINYFKKTF